jgi:methyl-accepting chemotaxis protein
MSENQPHSNRFVPLRVRFHSASDLEHKQREQQHMFTQRFNVNQLMQKQSASLSTAITNGGEALPRAQQVKELIRLGNILRADIGLDELLQQIASSISTCTGFQVAIILLARENQEFLEPAAFAGTSEDNKRIVRENPPNIGHIQRIMRPEFQISQSYFISHLFMEDFSDFTWVQESKNVPERPDEWHAEDALFVPLFSPRQQKILGMLSLDEPADSKLPTVESIEMIELFANQAAIAIDNAQIFQAREFERLALEHEITSLKNNLESIQSGELRTRVKTKRPELQPIAEAVNSMADAIGMIIANAKMVTNAVDEHTRDVQRSSELLVRDTSQQERQVHHISHVIDDMTKTMEQISEKAANLSCVAVEAVDVTNDGQGAVDRAVEGMKQVREATMQSSRVMKRLGESSLEINDAVTAITDLTPHLNLLALNAAIEATRAGEHGQGFAVIAQEIRKLAVHSSEAAHRVSQYIHTIQHETASVSASIEQSTQKVVQQTELVMQTGVALEAISVVTEQMSGLVQGISAAAQAQLQGSQLVAGSVEEISRMTSEITLHMRNMQESLGHLVTLTDALRSRMALIRVNEQ